MKNVEWLMATRFAHRGLHNNKDIPENSLIAFENAVNHGYGMEFDVYLTDDNVLIVHHNFSLYDTCGLDTNVYKVDTTKLDTYKLFNTKHSIPLLSDMLKVVDGKVPLILEIKATRKVSATCSAIYEMIKNYKGDICVESFDARIVNWWLKNHNEYVIGQLYSTNKFALSLLKLFRQYRKVDFLAVACANITDKYFSKIKKKHPDKLIINWTVKTKNDLDNALKYADNYIFECDIKNENYIPLNDVNI